MAGVERVELTPCRRLPLNGTASRFCAIRVSEVWPDPYIFIGSQGFSSYATARSRVVPGWFMVFPDRAAKITADVWGWEIARCLVIDVTPEAITIEASIAAREALDHLIGGHLWASPIRRQRREGFSLLRERPELYAPTMSGGPSLLPPIA